MSEHGHALLWVTLMFLAFSSCERSAEIRSQQEEMDKIVVELRMEVRALEKSLKRLEEKTP